MIYYLKRIISFVKTDVILLKTIGIKYIIAYLLSFFILNTVSIIFKNKSIGQGEYISLFTIDMIADLILTLCNLVFFTYFFIQLKKQNFFKHLLTNRGFYIAEFELLLFVISLSVFFIPITLPFVLFLSPYELFETIFFYLTDIIGALLIANWKLWKYILLTLGYTAILCLILTLLFVYTSIPDDMSEFVVTTLALFTQLTIFITIELNILKKSILK